MVIPEANLCAKAQRLPTRAMDVRGRREKIETLGQAFKDGLGERPWIIERNLGQACVEIASGEGDAVHVDRRGTVTGRRPMRRRARRPRLPHRGSSAPLSPIGERIPAHRTRPVWLCAAWRVLSASGHDPRQHRRRVLAGLIRERPPCCQRGRDGARGIAIARYRAPARRRVRCFSKARTLASRLFRS